MRRKVAENGARVQWFRRPSQFGYVLTECLRTRVFGSLKVERLHGQRFKTRRQAMDEVIAWMLWYNRSRLHSTLGYVSPMRFEENWRPDQPRQASA